jgi:hypothetical protein
MLRIIYMKLAYSASGRTVLHFIALCKDRHVIYHVRHMFK